jgi:hypothetical protein
MIMIARTCRQLRASGSGFGILALGLGLALSTGACSRAHLTATHGRAFHEIFAAQTANPNPRSDPKSIHGLDSQEAAIISGSYRKALSPKADSGGGNNQLLLMAPSKSGAAAANYMPAPSVP